METPVDNRHNLGNGIKVTVSKKYVIVWRNEGILFQENIDCREHSPEFRQFVVNLVQKFNAQKSKIATCFGLSRQTIDNWIDSFEEYGLNGLINSTKENVGRTKGNKARQFELQRKEERLSSKESLPNLFDIVPEKIQEVADNEMPAPEEMPFSDELSPGANRYAGSIIPQILLIHRWSWFSFIIGFFGKGFKIFQVFMLMAAKNIRSLEQMKNVRLDEAGKILGIGKLPSVTDLRIWFRGVSEKSISNKLKSTFFGWQLKNAIVGTMFWFTDGHVLPYSGKEQVRKMYNTKRRLVEPGRTNLITCDSTGRVVEFEIQEGQGDLRGRIIALHQKWKDQLPEPPVHVFDREGHGGEFYYQLVSAGCPFVCWEKNSNQKKLQSLGLEEFNQSFSFNDVEYKYITSKKQFTIETEETVPDTEEKKVELERYYVLNTKTQKRTSVLANNANGNLSDDDCIIAILSRWGASENTNKYLKDNHPLHYQPGFKYTESKNQIIANPEVYKVDTAIKNIKTELAKQYKKLASTEKKWNKNGGTRQNDVYSRLKNEIAKKNEQIQQLQQQKSELPEKIDISGLEDYKSYQVIDNEAKNLFDIVTVANWNARKEGVDILKRYYDNPNDIVDLYQAIINCQGKVQVNKNQVIVTLEPLQQKSRRVAQIDFCKYLTSLYAKTPDKKHLIVQVANYQ